MKKSLLLVFVISLSLVGYSQSICRDGNTLYGLKDDYKEETWIVKPVYNAIIPNYDNTFNVLGPNWLWGIIDSYGNELVSCNNQTRADAQEKYKIYSNKGNCLNLTFASPVSIINYVIYVETPEWLKRKEGEKMEDWNERIKPFNKMSFINTRVNQLMKEHEEEYKAKLNYKLK